MWDGGGGQGAGASVRRDECIRCHSSLGRRGDVG